MAEAQADEGWDIQETFHMERLQDHGGETINEYKICRLLGEGSFATVYLCERRVGEPPYREFALKMMSKRRLKKIREAVTDEHGCLTQVSGLDKVMMEVQVMRHLFHRNIVCLFEVINSPEEDDLALVLEYMSLGPVMTLHTLGGPHTPTFAHMGTPGPLSDGLASRFFLHLVDGLLFLHDQGIAHRDIKPENLLLTEQTKTRTITLRISDFGCSKRFNITGGRRAAVTDTVGTMSFWPPEVMRKQDANDDEPPNIDDEPFGPDASYSYCPFMADVWAAGVTLFIFVTGTLPFWATSADSMLETIAHTSHAQKMEEIGVLGPVRELVDMLLDKEPYTRVTLQQAREHEWLLSAREEQDREEASALAST